MSALTPERLAEIRERATCPSAKESAFLAADECLYPLIEDDVPDLLAEVKRLRAGIEALDAKWSRPSPNDGHGMRAPIDPDYAARQVRALLNPPEATR